MTGAGAEAHILVGPGRGPHGAVRAVASDGASVDLNDAVEARTKPMADDARVIALDILGETSRATRIVARRLRTTPSGTVDGTAG